MKLKPEQFAQQIKGALAPVYALFSDEPLFLVEAEQALRARAAQAGFSQVERYDADSSFDFNRLASERDSLSLFAEKRLILLRLNHFKLGDGERVLQDWLASPPEDIILLISSPRPDSKIQKNAWFKNLEQQALLVIFYPPSLSEWPDWVEGRLRRAGLRLDAESLDLLAQRSEGNMLACTQAIAQLQLLAGNGPLDRASVLAAVGDSARYNVYELSDALIAADPRQALRILDHLRMEGQEATGVLWVITRELRLLLALQQKGANLMALWTEHRIFGARQQQRVQAARQLPASRLTQALRQCGQIDRAIKGRSAWPVWEGMADLILALRLPGRPANRPLEHT